jgi:hypothetical protein
MYRDATAEVAAEATALAAQRSAEIDALSDTVVTLYARRHARVAFGVTGAISAAAAVVGMLAQLDAVGWALVAGWIAALGAYGITRWLAQHRARRILDGWIASGGDPYRDAAALRALDVPAHARELVGRCGDASVVWPLVAAVLIGPHTLHLAIGALFNPDPTAMRFFDDWLRTSAAAMAPVFAYAVVAACRFPRTRAIGGPIGIAVLLSVAPVVMVVCALDGRCIGVGIFIAYPVVAVVVAATAAVVTLLAHRPMRAIMAREGRLELRIQPRSVA